MLTEGKLPYFALLRNLRNICEQGTDETVNLACNALCNEVAIKKSLVLPFRYISAVIALKEVKMNESNGRKLTVALSRAIEIALGNVPEFPGKNLVVLDCSGSMFSSVSPSPIQIGSLFAACLAKRTNADCILFGNQAEYVNPNLSDSLFTIAGAFSCRNFGGTDYRSWTSIMNKPYDRIFVLSDGEAWGGYKVAETHMKAYRSKFKADPSVFNFDLQGNGTMQFPEKKTYCLAGFSDKTLELLQMLEKDKSALITKIEAINV